MARDFYASGEILSSNHPATSNTHHHEFFNQIHGFDDDTNPSNHHHQHQIFSLNPNAGLIHFSKQQHHNHHHHHHHHQISMTSGLEETSGGENLLMEDSSSSMRCSNVNFPCDIVSEERPPTITATRPQSQCLSLSLSPSNPSSISLQHFELRPHAQHDHVTVVGSSRQGYFGKPHHNLQMMMMMMMMNNSPNQHHHQNEFQILRSKYLAPVQELLNEICSLGTKQSDHEEMTMKNQKGEEQEWGGNNDDKDNHRHDDDLSARKHVPPLHSLEFMELHKRKAKLLSMLDEINRRHHHYRDQMRAVATAFETAAGVGAAETYTASAAKAMSRHFRCLRDGVARQIHATKKAMGEREDPVAPGMTRGDTPRLRLLDQAFRQQKVYSQMSLVDAHPWRPQRGLPERAVSILRAWLFEHFLHPYPSDVDKHILARQTGLSRSQVSNWFINARVRLWKPMIEEMYSEETRGEQKDEANISNQENDMLTGPIHEPNRMNRVDPESLSSIITNPSSITARKPSQTHQHATTSSFGSAFDFQLYGHQAVTYDGDSSNQVSGKVGQLQYSSSLLDGDHQALILPHRNLMGAQLVHDIV
ncbi:PREDICTED: homeobox protein BEL1 homolog [Tarenaya hassleriana]|uniref:homeobox protein BEL1 homolog n=1 Tax=Tarenaya hassleriana TaxID=28532 RepID=UPI00053C8E07|nr:PREDICTED: homeobox protein BEL1 homolog [Tarenaya hassleriana]XP_010533637.1 PREDICTED: homeobox protein BEL1 homolog [Tarenaya hassleriana]